VPNGPEQLWVSDITYLWVAGRWSYLSLITDAYSHRIMGFHLSDSLAAAGCIAALEMALANRLYPDTKLVHHSDRGLQYRCQGYLGLLRGADTPPGDPPRVASSMTQSGDPLENAMAERVNGILKVDMGLADETYFSQDEATAAVAAVVNTYNNLRGHASIDRMVPAAAHLLSGPIRNLWKRKGGKNEG
jgi:transposase InsO family protein